MCRSRKSLTIIVACLIILSMLMSSVMGLTVFAAENEGSCGEDLKWSFSAGTLTITGKGKMANYNETVLAPWYHLRDQIVSVRLPKSLESVGSLAFYDCVNLKAISIPEGTAKIGDKAFYNCKGLLMVNLPNRLKEIGRSAFYNCEKLCSVSIPDTVEIISDKAFFLCRNIVSIVIPEQVATLGKQAFAYCENLLRVEIKAPIQTVPEWCFYGCTSLAEIKLPETVTDIEDYAFKRCDNLYTVYHSGNKNVAKTIRNQIAEDVPNFETSGYVSSGEMEETTQSSVVDDSDGKVNQTNTNVTSKDGIILVTQVQSQKEQNKNHYEVYFTLTVDGEIGWEEAILSVRKKLSEINESYAIDSRLNGIKITVYLKNTYTVNEDFLKELAGRKILLEVIDANSSVWTIDCRTLNYDDIKKDVGVSYTISEAPSKIEDKLGTEDCFQLVFNETSKIDTNIVVSLPQTTAKANAFLYQIVLGKPQRLQASVVDSNANAHFYLSSVKNGAKYVIGINVPNENTSDIIIPDSASDVFGAIARLEKIEYASGTVRTLAGFTFSQILFMVIGLLVFISIVIGIIMYMLYKKKPQQYAVVAKSVSGAQIKIKGIKARFRHNKK